MNKIIPLFLLIVSLSLTSCATIGESANPFIDEVLEGENDSVLYLYRLKSMVGAAVSWEVTISEFDKTEQQFINEQKLGKLQQNGYIPVQLKSDTLYYIKVGTAYISFVSAKPDSNVLIRLKGLSAQMTAINNYAAAKIGYGEGSDVYSSFVELAIDKAFDASNEQEFANSNMVLLIPSEQGESVMYQEIQGMGNCLK